MYLDLVKKNQKIFKVHVSQINNSFFNDTMNEKSGKKYKRME